MKSNVHYWGSVRFYKHLILSVTALMILMPSIGFLAMLARNWRLKQDYLAFAREQTAYISQLEKELEAYYIKDEENTDTDRSLEEKESQRILEAPDGRNTAGEVMLTIPFSVDLDDWKYCLVNDYHPLPESYHPELVETVHGKQVHHGIADALEQMLAVARTEGMELLVCSAYRDYEKQAELVENSIEKLMTEGYSYAEAHWKTKQQLALVGVSEHHTGLAVDIVGDSYQCLDEGQADTPEAGWLAEHAHEYGFILRYPEDKEAVTGILYESWHYRYVGEEAAAFMKEHQLCLEEFLELAENQEKDKKI